MNAQSTGHYRRQTPDGGSEALGQSEVFLEFQERLSQVAPVNRPVLLLGERGTGKELAANRLHYLSKTACRRQRLQTDRDVAGRLR